MKKLLHLTEQQKLSLQFESTKMLDKKYEFGAEVDLTKPAEEIESIDCSEMIQYLYYQIGYRVTDGSFNQLLDCAPIDEKYIQVGDLAFKRKHGKIVHVGMIFSINPNVIIEAEGWYGRVILRDLAKFKDTKPKAAQYVGLYRFQEEKALKNNGKRQKL